MDDSPNPDPEDTLEPAPDESSGDKTEESVRTGARNESSEVSGPADRDRGEATAESAEAQIELVTETDLDSGIPNRPVAIHVPRDVLATMAEHVTSDTTVEQGGMLAGRYDESSHTTIIVAAIPALEAESREASLKFTHETWDYVGRVMDEEHPDLQVVGWYHSHPHFGIFLSEYDLFIHRNFFAGHWQVAYVIDPLLIEDGWFGWQDEVVTEFTFLGPEASAYSNGEDTILPDVAPPRVGTAGSRDRETDTPTLVIAESELHHGEADGDGTQDTVAEDPEGSTALESAEPEPESDGRWRPKLPTAPPLPEPLEVRAIDPPVDRVPDIVVLNSEPASTRPSFLLGLIIGLVVALGALVLLVSFGGDGSPTANPPTDSTTTSAPSDNSTTTTPEGDSSPNATTTTSTTLFPPSGGPQPYVVWYDGTDPAKQLDNGANEYIDSISDAGNFHLVNVGDESILPLEAISAPNIDLSFTDSIEPESLRSYKYERLTFLSPPELQGLSCTQACTNIVLLGTTLADLVRALENYDFTLNPPDWNVVVVALNTDLLCNQSKWEEMSPIWEKMWESKAGNTDLGFLLPLESCKEGIEDEAIAGNPTRVWLLPVDQTEAVDNGNVVVGGEADPLQNLLDWSHELDQAHEDCYQSILHRVTQERAILCTPPEPSDGE